MMAGCLSRPCSRQSLLSLIDMSVLDLENTIPKISVPGIATKISACTYSPEMYNTGAHHVLSERLDRDGSPDWPRRHGVDADALLGDQIFCQRLSQCDNGPLQMHYPRGFGSTTSALDEARKEDISFVMIHGKHCSQALQHRSDAAAKMQAEIVVVILKPK